MSLDEWREETGDDRECRDDVTVGALEQAPSTTVHLTGRNGGRQRVHTDADCRHLNRGKETTDRALTTVPDDWPVCRECLGIASTGQKTAGDPQKTREKLLGTSPEEAGLSPIGDRRDEADFVADGSTDSRARNSEGTR